MEHVDLIDVSVDIPEDNTVGLSTPEPQNQDCASQIVELEPQNLGLDPDLPSTSEACSSEHLDMLWTKSRMHANCQGKILPKISHTARQYNLIWLSDGNTS